MKRAVYALRAHALFAVCLALGVQAGLTSRASAASRDAGQAPAVATTVENTLVVGAAVSPAGQTVGELAMPADPKSFRTNDHGSDGATPARPSAFAATCSFVPAFDDEYNWIGFPPGVDGPRTNTFPTSATCEEPEPSGSAVYAA